MSHRRAAVLLMLAGLAWLASGVTIIQPNEQGIVRRLGRLVSEPWEPGLHLGLPWGLDQVDRVRPGETRTLTTGALGAFAPGRAGETSLLTGDANVLNAQVTLNYHVSDPARYLFSARDQERVLEALVEAALAESVASRGIDGLLTSERSELADALVKRVQTLADTAGLGIAVRGARLGRIAPPSAVADAFADADRARGESRQSILRAEEERDRLSALARGQAREILDGATARHDRAIEVARGEADRFTSHATAARADSLVVRRKLLRETLAQILPRLARFTAISPGQSLDLSLITESPDGEKSPIPNADPLGGPETLQP